MVRRLTLILSAFALCHCGEKSYENANMGSNQAATGYETEDGRKFVVGNEPRLEHEVLRITPRVPIKKTEQEAQIISFHQSLKEFRFLRYDNSENSPSRLGKDRFTFEVQVSPTKESSKVIQFSGYFTNASNGQLLISEMKSSSDPEYSLKGDISQEGPQVIGTFYLTHTQKNETQEATVLYRAYEANLNVRTPEDVRIEEHVNLFKRIENLRSNTKAWVNTFVVPMGVSTVDIAVIRKSNSTTDTEANSDDQSLESLLRFSGRSVETLKGPTEKFHVADKSETSDLESIELIGNGEGEDTKIFSLTVKDDKGEDTEILMDIEREKTEEELLGELKREEDLLRQLYEPVSDFENEDDKDEEDKKSSDEKPAEKSSSNEDHFPPAGGLVVDASLKTQTPEVKGEFSELPEDVPIPMPQPEYTPPKTDAPAQSTEAPRTSSLGNSNKSYLTARNNSNALKIVKDFDKNFTLNGVQKEINNIKKSRAEVNKLKKFFKFANPFRGLIEKIANAYDVPPQFAYVSLIESAYFYGGQYRIQVAPGSTATGPFQILIATARSLGLRVDSRQTKGSMPSSSDERKYFAPSACGAAKYFRNNAKMFSRDATLAILAYNQGEGRAGQLAKRYGYTYAQISKNNVAGVQYSNKKLAAYFIAGVYKGSSFDVDSESPRNLPSNGSIYPSKGLKDQTCARAVR